MEPSADNAKFAQIVMANNEGCIAVRKLVEQYNRGILTEMDLVDGILNIDPDLFPVF